MRTILYRVTSGEYEGALFTASYSKLNADDVETFVGYLVDATIIDEVEVPISNLEVFAEYEEE